MNQVESIVIVEWAKGYVAHLRFSDPKMDADLSSNSKYMIYRLIEAHVDRMVGIYR